MPKHVRVILLSIAVAIVYVGLVPKIAASRLPGDHSGYAPEQPIDYSHRLHAGELQIPCLYCHAAAERSRSASIPSANICMNCHKYVQAPLGAIRAEEDLAKAEDRPVRRIVSPELQKLYDALGLDPDMKRNPLKPLRPLEWVRVHRLPSHARFDHRAHVHAGIECQKCHGPVETMERVRQAHTLKMGWCVNCHRESNAKGIGGKPVAASLDCSACHY